MNQDNHAKQDSLNATEARLQREIQAERERLEASLNEWQNAQEAADEAQRDVDQIALVSTKNQCWKDLSWIVRQTLSGFNNGYGGNGHEHGLSAGPVYGYLSNFAQKSGTGGSVPFDSDYSEQYGFGAEGAEDGYDPYGYGDWGWGYGYAQLQYKQIAEKMDNMRAAQELIFQQNEDRIEASQAGLKAVQEEAWDQWSEFLDHRWAEWNDAVEAQNAWWAQNVADRTATMQAGIDAAEKAVADGRDAKIAEFNRMEKEIRWHITSIYNYDVQNELNKNLTAARTEQDRICDAKQAEWAAYLVEVKATWDDCVKTETDDLYANTADATATLEAGKQGEKDIFAQYKLDQQARFEQWAEDERAAVAQFVSDCQEAWEWILVSYCLRHGDGEVYGAGHGCSWGSGAGAGNAGFLKGVAIEEHDDVLSYGQDIDIKHIHNEQGLIDEAVWWTMQGVEEEVVRQQADVDADQVEREAGVVADKQALRDALTARLGDSIASLDDTVARLAQELLDRENSAMAGVESDRDVWEKEIDALRAALLWDIKEIVWKLGYTQGYVYGAHDGHDKELLADITAKKDQYEAAIVD